MIFLPGDKGDKVYLLKAGVVKISRYSDSGKEIILGMVNPGEIFGEIALVEPGPRSADVRVLEPISYLEIDWNGLKRIQ